VTLRRWLDDFLADVRYGARSLLAHRTFTVIALVTLTVGIGANGLIFSVVSGVLFRPLPYADADRLVQVYGTQPAFGSRGAVPNLRDYRASSRLVASMSGYVPGSRIVSGAAGSERVGLVRAERSLFQVLGVDPIAGRTFRDDDPAGTLVVAAPFARRRFGTESAAVGETLMVEGQTHQIVGVMPDVFRFPYATPRMSATLPSLPYELWAVLDLPPNPRTRMDRVIGRLADGATRQAAQEEMNVTARQLAAANPEMTGGLGIELVALDRDIVGPVRNQLLILLAAVGLVLLVACANVANLLLVRGTSRSREFAVRTAIGAGRGRLVRQLLTESMLLSCAGGVLALLFVTWGLPVLLSMPGLAVPRAVEIGVDWRVVGFLLFGSVLTGLVFGLLPALAASWTSAQEALKSGAVLGRSGQFLGRFRDALATAEIALAFVLVVGAGLLVREFVRLRDTDTGMRTASVLTMHLAPSLKAPEYYAIANQVAALPGVRAAAFAQMLPLQTWGWTATFAIDGRPAFSAAERPVVELRYITPSYFDALGIPILAGRGFTEADVPDSERVIIVNETLAGRYFRGLNPIGQKTDRGVIVGVAGNVRQSGLDRDAMPDIYYPMAQNVSQISDIGMTLIVSTNVPARTVTAPIRELVGRAHPHVAIFGVGTMDEIVRDSLAGTAFYSWLVGSFAILALLVASAGVYGVMSSIVAARTREFGIRLALGCDRRRVERLVLGHAAVLAAAGLAIGAAGAVASAGFLESLVVGASRLEAATMVGSALILAAVALVAAGVPARRAARVDPMRALREE
jgi:predicted permease